MKSADVIVIGLGAMGAATTYQLARRGTDVLAIDQFSPPHDQGSSHGETRITRQAIGEGTNYVPLVLRSQDIWRELEDLTGESLFLACGALILGPAADTAMHHGKPSFLGSTFEAAKRFGIPHEDLTAREIGKRFRQFKVTGSERGYYEPGGGLVFPERCIGAQIELASRNGARIHVNERVVNIEARSNSVQVTTDRAVYEAAEVVLAAGAWLPGLAGKPLASLSVHRQALFWFETTQPELYHSDRCPVYIWMHGDNQEEYFYGFPIVSGSSGVKVASERYGFPLTGPDQVDRTVSTNEADAMYAEHIQNRLDRVTSQCIRKAACCYTATPDRDFVIDRHPDCERITLISACSGHGFKHSAAIGEEVAKTIIGKDMASCLRHFRISRLRELSPS